MKLSSIHKEPPAPMDLLDTAALARPLKVLLATYSGDWVYVPELIEALRTRGVYVDLFEIDELGPLSLSTRVAFRFPSLRATATVAQLKRRLLAFADDYDAINIHYAAPIYRDLAPALKRRAGRLVTSIWGSDFLRASEEDLQRLGVTFEASDTITTDNPEIGHRLVERFPEIESKVQVARFGLASLDRLRDLLRTETPDDCRRRLGLPSDRTIVTIGYNGSREQQHALMIGGLAQLPGAAKAGIHVVVPMTYGADAAYQQEVRDLLDAAGLHSRIVIDRLDATDICRLRLASDFAINMQTTDTLSASIQEHIFAGSTMIVGDWLPYGVFEQMGIPIQRVSDAAGIAAALQAHGLHCTARVRPAHVDRIYGYSSWAVTAEHWLALYRR